MRKKQVRQITKLFYIPDKICQCQPKIDSDQFVAYTW